MKNANSASSRHSYISFTRISIRYLQLLGYYTVYSHILNNILNAVIAGISQLYKQVVNLEMHMFGYLLVKNCICTSRRFWKQGL